MTEEKKEISRKHKAFINNYFKYHMNGTEAYVHTYGTKNRATARANASELLAKPNIKAEVARRVSEGAMSADEVLFALGNMARASVDDIIKIDDKGHVALDFAKAKENGAIHLIKSIIPTSNGTRVELHDQQTALVNIGKHLGMFVNKTEHSGELDLKTAVHVYIPENGRDN